LKAVLLEKFGGPENMFLGEAELPQAKEGEILIRVQATSVNRPDIVQRQGNYQPPPGDSEILGLEVAGVVEAVGDSVTRWQVGDRVMALIGGGGYAEYAKAHQYHAMKIPKGMSFEEAACVCETYLTAFLNVFMLGEFANGQIALLHGGGGGVNTAAIQLCQYLAPEAKLIVTCSSGKVERIQAMGVDHVIDYQNRSFVEEVAKITSKKGVNIILDHLGADYLAGNMRSLSIYGKLLQIGVMSGAKAELNLAVMMVKRQQIIGSVLRARSLKEKAEIISTFDKKVGDALHNRQIVPEISRVFHFSESADAHRMMESSQHFGKIVLTMTD